VSISDLTPADAQAAGIKEIRGALVGGASPGQESPAAKAGIEAGDVIVAIDGQPIDRVAQLQRVIRNHKPGDVVEVDVMRFGAKKSFKVKLIEAPTEQQIASAAEKGDENAVAVQPASYDKLGISVEAPSVEKWNRTEVPENQRGLAVMEVDAMGPAYRLLSPGRDVIVKVLSPKAVTIRTVADLNTALGGVSDGDVISLLVYNMDGKSTRVVNLRVGG